MTTDKRVGAGRGVRGAGQWLARAGQVGSDRHHACIHKRYGTPHHVWEGSLGRSGYLAGAARACLGGGVPADIAYSFGGR